MEGRGAGRRIAEYALTLLFVPIAACLLYLPVITFFVWQMNGRPWHFLCALGGGSALFASYGIVMQKCEEGRMPARALFVAIACLAAGLALLSRVPLELLGIW